tara:strand:- start:6355 stop:7104 length:750 start_codon:yes stop_codon:yes gene_type:complete
MAKIKSAYGLIGKGIGYSFSRSYFRQKFKEMGLACHSYQNFDCENLTEVLETLKQKNLKGVNVTIPYKEKIIPYLDRISKEANEIRAVNTISINDDGKLLGYNTDYYGFQKSLFENLNKKVRNALILGTGGSSKAIKYVLKENLINYNVVSRTRNKGNYVYNELDKGVISEHQLIINTTPLGTYPNIQNCPDINFDFIKNHHILFDLTYNPKKTKFLLNGELKGAKTINGYDMLIFQAEKSWSIWNQTN